MMRIPSKGEIVRTDTAYQGEIVILPSDSVRLNDVLGDQTRLLVKGGARPSHAADDDCAENGSAKRTAVGFTQLKILTCCVAVDSITHEIILLLAGCSWRLFPLCCRKNTSLNSGKGTSHLYGAALSKSSQPHHPYRGAQPVLGIHRTVVTPLSLGSGVQYESRVSLGYLNQSFQNAVRMVSVTGWSRACLAET